ncbi:hypothetical protein NMY22_g7120 [Coprinellus aureogranulatus]|nr:hypothetical protein NMY22_g7120 [Coprinellus aureogranulatus]
MPAGLPISVAASGGISTKEKVDNVKGHMEGLVRVTAAGGAALGTAVGAIVGAALTPVAFPVVAAVQAFSKKSDGKK